VDELVYAFGKADFFALDDSYSAMMTDVPTFTVHLDLGDKEKSVRREGCGPRALAELEYLIDQIVGSVRWIGEHAYTGPAGSDCADPQTPFVSPVQP
jgi:hypothetical protein